MKCQVVRPEGRGEFNASMECVRKHLRSIDSRRILVGAIKCGSPLPQRRAFCYGAGVYLAGCGKTLHGGLRPLGFRIHEHMIVDGPLLTSSIAAPRLSIPSLLAVRILSLLLLVAGLRAFPLQAAAAANGLSAAIAMSAPAAPQGTPPAAVTGGARASKPSAASAAQTAPQWMAEGLRAQKAGNAG